MFYGFPCRESAVLAKAMSRVVVLNFVIQFMLYVCFMRTPKPVIVNHLWPHTTRAA